MQLDGSGSAQSITVVPVGSTANVLYQVPIDLTEEIPLGVTARNSQGVVIANGSIDLRHPPVVLVHGIWSNSGVFAEMAKYLSANGLVGARANYSAHSADSFHPLRESAPIDALVQAVEEALNVSRGRGIVIPGQRVTSFGDGEHHIAASQVDVVAHSMGGLVARAREHDKGPRIAFRRKENRDQGEFHKLITIGTPHQGSEFADYLAKYKCWPVGQAVIAFQRPINQAIYDLQTTSRTLSWLGSTVVPSHAIAGIKPTSSMTESQMNIALIYGFESVDGILGKDGQHDTIVRVVSQKGGLNEDTTATTVGGVVHSTGLLATLADDGITETTSSQIFDLILQLLAAPTKSVVFDSIGPYTPTGVELVNPQCTLLNSLRTASGVPTVSPAPGTVVRPGEAIQIVFSVPVASTSAAISVGGNLTKVTGSAGSFSTTYELPSDAIGRIAISAMTLDLGEGNLSASTYVVALPSTPPAGLAPSPGSVDFAVPGQTTALTVLGTYGDGATADLTPSASGTTYSTLSGTNSVITVSAEGVVQAVANGQDTVVIQNGGQTASVTATVNITNQPPTLAALADASVVAGQTLDIPLTASDPDGNTVLLSGTGLPSFVTLVDNHNGTGVLSVHPSATDVGTYRIFISVVDDGNPALGLSRSLQLTVFTAILGDLNGDGVVTMADAIIALQVMARVQPSGLRSDYTTSGADVNLDGKMGIPELLYILQKAAGAR
jgi:pimeloyl-ACP methyl ester carboxylesterase